MKVDKQFIALKGLIVQEKTQKILIIKESSRYADATKHSLDKRGLPGGRLHQGEPRKDGLQREIQEEVGLTIKIQQPIYVGDRYPKVRAEVRQIIGVYFHCTTTKDAVRLGQDHDEYRRIDPTQYTDYELLPPEDKVIQSYLDKQS